MIYNYAMSLAVVFVVIVILLSMIFNIFRMSNNNTIHEHLNVSRSKVETE